jgi:hypothetical protein
MEKHFTTWTWMKIMDEIHHKKTFFNETFQMNLFLVKV